MNFSTTRYGISSFGYCFGEETQVSLTASDYVSDPEKVLQWGCKTYRRARKEVFSVDLATSASREALSKVNLDAEKIDLIVYASSDLPEYTYWDSSTALAKALNMKRIQSMLLNNEGCGAGIRVFSYIAGVLAIQPEINTVLLVVVNRVSEFHRNRMDVVSSVLSDGAVAVVIQRNHAEVEWLATDHFADPEFCDLFKGSYGGAKSPIFPEGWTNRDEPGYKDVTCHFNNDLSRMKDFLLRRNELMLESIDRACVRAGISRKIISHLIYTGDARPGAIEAIANPLGIPLSRTNFEYAKIYGHMGAADQLVGLGMHIERGDLQKGDTVVLSGISTGMQWCSTLFKI